jgi:hypothetical protein
MALSTNISLGWKGSKYSCIMDVKSFITLAQIDAMNTIKKLISDQKFSKNVFALAQDYSNWETDEVVSSSI